MDEKKKKLKRMATWTVAIFATIFAVTFAVLWMLNYKLSSTGLSTIGAIFSEAWLIILLDLVLCVGVYVGYKLYLDKKK
jgi:hypothetical protein